MKIIQTTSLSEVQACQIDQLWDDEYPIELKGRFGQLLNGVERFHHNLIENEQQEVIAWSVAFFKDNETRFSIIVRADQQGKGLGAALVERFKSELDEFYGWVIDHNSAIKPNGENYQSPLPFYKRMGFEVLHNERIDNEMLKAVKIKFARTGNQG